jgi:hypothetical protein
MILVDRRTNRKKDGQIAWHPNSLMYFHLKRALLWLFNIAYINKHVHRPSSNVLPDFNQIWISSTDYHKSLQYQNHCNSCSRSRLIHAERRTYRVADGWAWRRLIGAFGDNAIALRITCNITKRTGHKPKAQYWESVKADICDKLHNFSAFNPDKYYTT